MTALLDAKTIFVLTGILSVLITVVFIAIQRGVYGVIEGVQSFSWAYGFFSLFTLLMMLRDIVHPLFSYVMADTALCLSLLLLLSGVCQLKHRTLPHIFSRVFLTLCLVSFSWYTFIDSSFTARVLITGLATIIIFSWIATLLVKEGPRYWRMGERILFVTLSISILAAVMRVGLSLEEQFDNTIMSVFAYRGALGHTLVVNLISTVFIAIGLIVITQDELRKDLERIASYDALTGALTRRVILNILEKAIAKVSRSTRPCALMMLDLDHFKRINDTYGHRVGDEVLIAVITAVETVLRGDTYLGRYGGEEFLIIMPDTDREQLEEVAQRILEIARQAEVSYQNKVITCTISIGAVIIDSENRLTITDPVTLADKALYQAKTLGRDQIVISDTPANELSSQAMTS